MKFSIIQKIGGLSVIIGASLLTLWTICWTFLLPNNERVNDYSIVILSNNWTWITTISFFGIIFMIFGFISVYSRIYEKAGVTGLIGFIFIILAYLFQAAKVTWEIFIYPVLAGNTASHFLIKDNILFMSQRVIMFRWIADLVILIGIILFCISLIRSKEFPKISGILFFIGAVLYGVGPMINVYIAITGVIILSIGCFFMGNKMLKG